MAAPSRRRAKRVERTNTRSDLAQRILVAIPAVIYAIIIVWKGGLIFTLGLIPLGIVSWTISLSDRYLLGAYLGTGPVGIYAAVYGLASQPFLIVQTALQRTMVAVYYRAVADGDRAKQSKAMRGWLAVVVGICGLGFVASLFLKNLVARIFLAPEYRSGANLIPWIAGGYMLWAIGSVFESKLHAQKRTHRILLVNVCTAVLSLVVPLVFIRWWGLIGAARACPVYFLGMAVLMWALSREGPGVDPSGGGLGGHDQPVAPQPAPAPLPEPISSAPTGAGGLEPGV
jgi:O-antigen/teichoic acid export membrane protein